MHEFQIFLFFLEKTRELGCFEPFLIVLTSLIAWTIPSLALCLGNYYFSFFIVCLFFLFFFWMGERIRKQIITSVPKNINDTADPFPKRKTKAFVVKVSNKKSFVCEEHQLSFSLVSVEEACFLKSSEWFNRHSFILARALLLSMARRLRFSFGQQFCRFCPQYLQQLKLS